MAQRSLQAVAALVGCLMSLADAEVVDFFHGDFDSLDLLTVTIPANYVLTPIFEWTAKRSGVASVQVNVTGKHVGSQTNPNKTLSIFMENITDPAAPIELCTGSF